MKLKRIGIILILIVLLPALFYSAYEITSLNENERLIAEIYNQQLDVILFSINQYAWDVSNNWANKINNAFSGTKNEYERSIKELLEITPAIHAVFLTDSLGADLQLIIKDGQTQKLPLKTDDLKQIVISKRQLINRLIHRKKVGYTKLESFTLRLHDITDSQILVLMFISDQKINRSQIVGMILNSQNFIREVLVHKIQEVSAENFLLGIFRKGDNIPVYATDQLNLDEIKLQRNIWLFPDHFLGIRLKGETIDDMAKSRFYRNLQLILLLDIILLFTVWILYRNIRNEVRLAQMKSDFVSNVSHEFRTPLSLIRMFSETLEFDRIKSKKKKKEYYQIISQETERLSHLINNILDFSKMEAGQKQYHLQPVDLNSIVQKALTLYKFHLENQGFKLEANLSKQELLIKADQEAVSEAIINLLDNAVKYSKKEKYIRIETGKDKNYIFLEIVDQGIGISQEDQKKIFDKFYRVSSGLVHNTKGSGLGLTLIKYIMDKHNGSVSVISELGKGSRFRLIFKS